MTYSSRWSVPFRRIKSEEGVMTVGQMHALVIFASKGYEKRTYPLHPERDDSPVSDYISKWQHNLLIDLWFYKFNFQWIGKELAPPNAAS